jgi:type III pantothenate kinase
MILAIDMGNTNIVIGCIDNEKIYFEERMATDLSKTELEYYVLFKTVTDLYDIKREEITGAIISSVVPPLVNVIKSAVEKLIGKSPYIVGSGIKTGLNIVMDNPRQLGSDLVVDAVAGLKEYGEALIIIDIGTATTISVVDKKKNYIGGVIMPGVKISSDSLVSRTAQLSKVSLSAPEKCIGKNTADCMKSGIIYGHAACLDGMIERIENELGYKCTVIATGGLAGVIIPHCKRTIIEDQGLLLKGLKIIYDLQSDVKTSRREK